MTYLQRHRQRERRRRLRRDYRGLIRAAGRGHSACIAADGGADCRALERVASERIGWETVTYVSNIYKYYITYRLKADQRERREAARRRSERASEREGCYDHHIS